MATGFHESTVAISVRNFLVVSGKSPVRLITKKLQTLWLSEVDEKEVRAALRELLARKLVKRLAGGLFESSTETLVQSRDRPNFRAKDREAAAWEGWRFHKPGGGSGFQLDAQRLGGR